MNKSDTVKLLFRFLKAEKAFIPFITAIREQKGKALMQFIHSRVNPHSTVSSIIDSAFTWAKTKEGSDFWYNLYVKANEISRK
jgi:hypothetical protein